MSVAGEVEDATAIATLKDVITADHVPETQSTHAEDINSTTLDTTKEEDTPDAVTTTDATESTTDIPADITAVGALSEELDTKDSADTLVDVAISSIVAEAPNDNKVNHIEDALFTDSSVPPLSTELEKLLVSPAAAISSDAPAAFVASEESAPADIPVNSDAHQVDVAALEEVDEKDIPTVIAEAHAAPVLVESVEEATPVADVAAAPTSVHEITESTSEAVVTVATKEEASFAQPVEIKTEFADADIPEDQITNDKDSQNLNDLIILSSSTDETCYGLPDPVDKDTVEATSVPVVEDVAPITEGVVVEAEVEESIPVAEVEEHHGVEVVVRADPIVAKEVVESHGPVSSAEAPTEDHLVTEHPVAAADELAIAVIVEPEVMHAKDTIQQSDVEESTSSEERALIAGSTVVDEPSVVPEDEILSAHTSTEPPLAAKPSVIAADVTPEDTAATEETEQAVTQEPNVPIKQLITEEVAHAVVPELGLDATSAEPEVVATSEPEPLVAAEKVQVVEPVAEVVAVEDKAADEVESESFPVADNVETVEHANHEQAQVPEEVPQEDKVVQVVQEKAVVVLIGAVEAERDVLAVVQESPMTDSATADLLVSAAVEETAPEEVALPGPVVVAELESTTDAPLEDAPIKEITTEAEHHPKPVVAASDFPVDEPAHEELVPPVFIEEESATSEVTPEEAFVTSAPEDVASQVETANDIGLVDVEPPSVAEASSFPAIDHDPEVTVGSSVLATIEETAVEDAAPIAIEDSEILVSTVPQHESSVVKEDPLQADVAADPLVEEAEHAAAAASIDTTVGDAVLAEPLEEPAEAIFSPQEVKLEWIPVSNTTEESEPTVAEGTPQISLTTDVTEDVIEVAAQEPERPKSPWTPSYSVSTQGAGVADDARELDEHKQRPEQKFEPTTTPEGTSEHTAVPEVGGAPAVALEIAEEPKVPTDDIFEPIVAVEEVKPLSWPVSYAVSSQGASPLHAPQVTDDADVPVIESLPEESLGDHVAQELHDLSKATTEELQFSAAPVLPEPTIGTVAVLDPEPLIDANTAEDIKAFNDTEHSAQPETRGLVDVDDDEMLPSVPVLQVEGDAAPLVDDAASSAERVERPWTPSYSVTRQGSSPAHSAMELEDEEPTPGAPVERPWTPSYSVTRQGTSPLLTSQVLEDDPVPVWTSLVEEPETLAVDIPVDATVEPVVVPPVVVHDGTAEVVPEPSVVDDIARPKSPWAASYTVTQQGPSPLNSPATEKQELPVHELLPSDSTAAEVSPALEVMANGKVTDVATDAAGVVHSFAAPVISIDTETPEDIPAESSSKPDDEVERPWTPSYSVTRQGSRTFSAVDAEENAAAHGLPEKIVISPAKPNEETRAFPVAETVENVFKVSSKPSLARLAPVSENEAVDTTSPPDLETLSPTTARPRLESTTSSRYFPGGWFSGPPKTPDDTRESLDHANGEFATKTFGGGDASPALEVPANTPIDGIDEKKHKSKWCIVM